MIHILNKQNSFLKWRKGFKSSNDIIKKIYEQIVFFLLLLFIGFLLPIYPGDWSPEVLIINGTTGKQGSVDSLKLIAISTGMQPIGELNGFSGSTKITNINIPEDPNPSVTQGLSFNGVDQFLRISDAPDLTMGRIIKLRSIYIELENHSFKIEKSLTLKS